MSLNPTNKSALFNLARLHLDDQNLTAADECLTLILNDPLYSKCFEAIDLLARVKQQKGMIFETISLYSKLGWSEASSYKSAEIWTRVDHSEALQSYNKGIAI